MYNLDINGIFLTQNKAIKALLYTPMQWLNKVVYDVVSNNLNYPSKKKQSNSIKQNYYYIK